MESFFDQLKKRTGLTGVLLGLKKGWFDDEHTGSKLSLTLSSNHIIYQRRLSKWEHLYNTGPILRTLTTTDTKFPPEVVRNNGESTVSTGSFGSAVDEITRNNEHTRQVFGGFTSGSFDSAEDERTRNNGCACLVLGLYMWWLGWLSSG